MEVFCCALHPTLQVVPDFVLLFKDCPYVFSDVAYRGMLAEFQVIWTIRLARTTGVVDIDFSSYSWRTPVVVVGSTIDYTSIYTF